MLITLQQMEKLHEIQLEMFRELKRVMEELGVRYYFIHGSLLSAVTTHRFIPEDDDIDIAIFREDYEKLLNEGNRIVSPKYFLQWCQNDDFPLSFAKFRSKETEFRQPVLEKYSCNKGIYIDIFPIDFIPRIEKMHLRVKRILLNFRINERLQTERSWKQKCVGLLAKIIYPSWRKALCKREALYGACRSGDYVTIFGGKRTEQKMPYCWFGEVLVSDFCGIDVNCPGDYDAYLTRIYGEHYLQKNPAEDRIVNGNLVEISASYIDFGGDIIAGRTGYRC